METTGPSIRNTRILSMTKSKKRDAAPGPLPLTAAFDDALRLAHDFHRNDVRKGTTIPYLSHLLQVAGLVVEAGGDEEQAIAALLHDAIEDADSGDAAASRERRIRERFGDRVTNLVIACTDGDPDEKAGMTWRERKKRYLRRLRNETDDDVLLISAADKLHNARAILRDYRTRRDELWQRFRGGKGGTLWYYRELVETYRARGFAPLVAELDEVVCLLELEAVRGSRLHVLNWLESPDFIDQLNAMIQPFGATVACDDLWQPRGWRDSTEARLDAPLAERTGRFDAAALEYWWLEHPGGANVPNWDLLATCQIDGKRGLVLVEAKAHEGGLSSKGKIPPKKAASPRSHENHAHIRAAIAEASDALRLQVPAIGISADQAYQFSNRVAHAWWLAKHGTPVVLLYLGFLGDSAMPKPFATPDAWDECLRKHAAPVFPETAFNRWIAAKDNAFVVTAASMPVPADQRPWPTSWPKVR